MVSQKANAAAHHTALTMSAHPLSETFPASWYNRIDLWQLSIPIKEQFGLLFCTLVSQLRGRVINVVGMALAAFVRVADVLLSVDILPTSHTESLDSAQSRPLKVETNTMLHSSPSHLKSNVQRETTTADARRAWESKLGCSLRVGALSTLATVVGMLASSVASADKPLTYTPTEVAYPAPGGGTYFANGWNGINNKGTLVGFIGDEEGTEGLPGAIYRKGKFESVSVAGSSYVKLNAVNDHEASVGVYYDLEFATHAFRAERNGVVTTLPAYPAHGLPDQGTVFTDNQATGINDRDVIVGYSASDSGTCHAWVYQKGAYKTYDKPGMACTRLYAINDDNIALGSYSSAGVTNHPFVIDLNKAVPTIHELVLPGVPNATSPNFSSFAKAINNKGEIVGYYYGGANGQVSQNFILNLKHNTIELWGPLGDPVTWTGINDAGVLVGSSDYPENGYFAVPSRSCH